MRRWSLRLARTIRLEAKAPRKQSDVVFMDQQVLRPGTAAVTCVIVWSYETQ
ncbi:unnamed protein product [marine sediment metagenome]|uniref:Uncharacterized protein n=1 Tax=marine sediment metagenome TaxID=412755 RepID=X0SQF7_9ZZZZ